MRRTVLALAVLVLTGCATTRGPLDETAAIPATTEPDPIAGTTEVMSGPVLPRPEGPVPLRVPAQVMRVWIAPWEDTRGDLHAPGYVFTEIEPRRWTLGTPAAASPATIRPLQIERRKGDGDTRKREAEPPSAAPKAPLRS